MTVVLHALHPCLFIGALLCSTVVYYFTGRYSQDRSTSLPVSFQIDRRAQVPRMRILCPARGREEVVQLRSHRLVSATAINTVGGKRYRHDSSDGKVLHSSICEGKGKHCLSNPPSNSSHQNWSWHDESLVQPVTIIVRRYQHHLYSSFIIH